MYMVLDYLHLDYIPMLYLCFFSFLIVVFFPLLLVASSEFFLKKRKTKLYIRQTIILLLAIISIYFTYLNKPYVLLLEGTGIWEGRAVLFGLLLLQFCMVTFLCARIGCWITEIMKRFHEP